MRPSRIIGNCRGSLPAKRTHHPRFLRYAWVASRFHGLPARELPAFLQDEIKVEPVSEDTVENAMEGLKGSGPKRKRGGGPPPAANPDAVVWPDWLRVDEIKLGLRKALIRIPNDGWPVDDLVDALRSMSGLRQIMVTKEDREIFAVLLYRNEDEADNLRARIEEHAGPNLRVRMHEIDYETDEPTKQTWLEIARREADEPSE